MPKIIEIGSSLFKIFKIKLVTFFLRHVILSVVTIPYYPCTELPIQDDTNLRDDHANCPVGAVDLIRQDTADAETDQQGAGLQHVHICRLRCPVRLDCRLRTRRKHAVLHRAPV